LCCFFLPETIHYKKSVELQGLAKGEQAKKLWSWTNPLRVIKLYQYPNLLFVGFASSSLVFNMYGLLTPIRYVINPRFHLTSPIQSGLFYIAPGCGYLLGIKTTFYLKKKEELTKNIRYILRRQMGRQNRQTMDRKAQRRARTRRPTSLMHSIHGCDHPRLHAHIRMVD
jgi:hypothetical protein